VVGKAPQEAQQEQMTEQLMLETLQQFETRLAAASTIADIVTLQADTISIIIGIKARNELTDKNLLSLMRSIRDHCDRFVAIIDEALDSEEEEMPFDDTPVEEEPNGECVPEDEDEQDPMD